MNALKYIELDYFELCNGKKLNLRLSYQNFGQPIGKSPVILINHALTGNSCVTGKQGWWNDVVGKGKVIDTDVYAVLAFNCPGNGYGGIEELFVDDYKDFTARDIARIFSEGLNRLRIHSLYAIIGASVGGGVTWELAALRPNLAEYVVPIATDWKSTDWVIGNCYIQDEILNYSSRPLLDARMHAMTFYRTPESFAAKFKREKQGKDAFKIEAWLAHHGEKLENGFQLSAYKMMNQILKTIDITKGRGSFTEVARQITSHIHIITINSDLLFKSEENWNTFVELKSVKENVTIGELKSSDGHDAFLIEHQQLTKLLKPVFSLKQEHYDDHTSSYIRNW
jgi:homoserine O-acetyltransferase